MDSGYVLTRGHPVSLIAWFTGLDPASGSYTGMVDRPHEQPLVGQIRYMQGDRSARLTFLLLGGGTEKLDGLDRLLEESAVRAGTWGACNVLAETPESLNLSVNLRRNGYLVYASQTIWQVPPPPLGSDDKPPDLWQPVSHQDEGLVRGFYQALVPPLVQSAEAWQPNRLQGYLHQQEGEILAFMETRSGPQGIYLLPVLHPAVSDPQGLLADLLERLPGRHDRPVYLAVRSYQAGLEYPLDALGCQAGERSVLMVKHLAVAQRASIYLERRTTAENPCPEPSASVLGMQARVEEPYWSGRLN